MTVGPSLGLAPVEHLLLSKVSSGPAESNYGSERLLIALPVSRLSAASQDWCLIYWAAPSAQANITAHPVAINQQRASGDV